MHYKCTNACQSKVIIRSSYDGVLTIEIAPLCPRQQTVVTARRLVIVKLQSHAVMDLIIFQRDVVLVDSMPLL